MSRAGWVRTCEKARRRLAASARPESNRRRLVLENRERQPRSWHAIFQQTSRSAAMATCAFHPHAEAGQIARRCLSVHEAHGTVSHIVNAPIAKDLTFGDAPTKSVATQPTREPPSETSIRTDRCCPSWVEE